MSLLAGTAYVALPLPAGAWIIENVLPQGGIGVLYGTAKDGKSFMALQLAEAIANPLRKTFFDLPIARSGPVAFIQLDMPRTSFITRMKKMQAADPTFDFSNVFIGDREMPNSIPYPFNILSDGPILKKSLEEISPVLVILDTFRDLHPSDENDAAAMRNVLTALMAAVPRGCAILIIAHRRKEWQFDTDDLIESLRGSTAIVGKMDIVFGLRRFKGSNNGTLRYTGRDTQQETIKVEFNDDLHRWDLDTETHKLISLTVSILHDTPTLSLRELGKQLSLKSDHWKDTKNPANAAFCWVKTKKHLLPKLSA